MFSRSRASRNWRYIQYRRCIKNRRDVWNERHVWKHEHGEDYSSAEAASSVPSLLRLLGGWVAPLCLALTVVLPSLPARGAEDPRSKVASLDRKRQEVRQTYDRLVSAVGDAQRALLEKQSQLIAASSELIRAQEELHRSLLAFTTVVRSAYKYGPDTLETVLKSNSLAEAGRARRYVRSRIERESQVLQRVVEANVAVAELTQRIDEEQTKLAAEVDRLADQLDATARLLADTEAALAAAQEELRIRDEMAKALRLVQIAGGGRYLARHRIATERQAEIMARYPFGPVTSVPAGLRKTGQVIEGIASWYGPGFNGLPTASGAIYDENLYTCASRDLPLGTILLVTYRDSSVLLLVNDRGPFVPGRVLDLSRAAKDALGMGGLAYIRAEVLEPL